MAETQTSEHVSDETRDQKYFASDETRYQEYFAQYRHLNGHMIQIPALSVTLTGAFWYAAIIVGTYGERLTPEAESMVRFALMIFAGVSNLALVFIAIRIRGVMQGYQKGLKAMSPDWPNSSNARMMGFVDYSIISIYSVLLLTAAFFSVAGAFVLFWGRTGYPLCIGILSTVTVTAILLFMSWALPRWAHSENKE